MNIATHAPHPTLDNSTLCWMTIQATGVICDDGYAPTCTECRRYVFNYVSGLKKRQQIVLPRHAECRAKLTDIYAMLWEEHEL